MTVATPALVAHLAARLCRADDSRILTDALRDCRAGDARDVPLVARERAVSLPPGDDLSRKLRLASLREDLRHGAMSQVARTAIASLDAAGLAPIACGGFAIADTAYPTPSRRHCHDIDLLVAGADTAAADSALRAAGFARLPGSATAWCTARGALLSLHGSPFRAPSLQRPPLTIADVRTVSRPAWPGRVLAAEWLLVCRLEHAWRAIGRAPLPIVMDAAVIGRTPAFDWHAAIDLAAEAELLVTLAVVAQVLHGVLGESIPADALCRLERGARQASAGAVLDTVRGASQTRAGMLATLVTRPPLWPALAVATPSALRRSRRRGSAGRPRWRPTDEQSLLLHAAIDPGASGVASWQAWVRHPQNAADAGRALEELGPAIHERLGGERTVPGLRTLAPAARWAWIQRQQGLRLAAQATRVLRGAEVEVVWLKGVALAALYPDSAPRPMGDIDLWVRPEQRRRAVEVLQGDGWRWAQPVGREEFRYRHARLLARGPGELLDLHWHALSSCCRPEDDEAFWSGTVTTGAGGIEARVLCPADQIVHAIAHAFFHRPRANTRWVTDAMTAIRGPLPIDWARVARQASGLRLVLSCREGLEYLSSEFHAPVPDDLVARLRHQEVTALERLERVHWRGGTTTWERAVRHWCLYCRAVSPANWWRAAAGFPAYVHACATHANSHGPHGGGPA